MAVAIETEKMQFATKLIRDARWRLSEREDEDVQLVIPIQSKNPRKNQQ
jgi:hypothetical protein